jgi:hypothetical protein
MPSGRQDWAVVVIRKSIRMKATINACFMRVWFGRKILHPKGKEKIIVYVSAVQRSGEIEREGIDLPGSRGESGGESAYHIWLLIVTPISLIYSETPTWKHCFLLTCIKKGMTKLKKFLSCILTWFSHQITKPLFAATVITGITFIVVLIILWLWKPNFYESFTDNLLSEVVGILFDIVIVVFLFSLINSKTEKKQRIQRYLEEIEDYRTWKEPEAAYRIKGLVRRLKELHYRKEIDLHLAYFNGADLSRVDFSKVNLSGGELYGTDFSHSNCSKANFLWTGVFKVDLSGANLTGAIIEIYQLKKVKSLEGATMMDGTSYDESWAKRIAEAEEPKGKEEPGS